MALELKSDDFSYGEEIPIVHTCEGEDRSPELHWSGVPDNAESLALIMEDPDAPDPEMPKMIFVHWIVYNMDPARTRIPAGRPQEEIIEDLGVQGKTDFKRLWYEGPCPPVGEHRYYFKLYALDSKLDLSGGATRDELLAAMEGRILDQAELMGVYTKQWNRS